MSDRVYGHQLVSFLELVMPLVEVDVEDDETSCRQTGQQVPAAATSFSYMFHVALIL